MVADDHGGARLNNDSHAVGAVLIVDLALVEAAYFNFAPSGEASVALRLVTRGSLPELLDAQTFEKFIYLGQVLVNHKVDFVKVPHKRVRAHHVRNHRLALLVHARVVAFARSKTLLKGLEIGTNLHGCCPLLVTGLV